MTRGFGIGARAAWLLAGALALSGVAVWALLGRGPARVEERAPPPQRESWSLPAPPDVPGAVPVAAGSGLQAAPGPSSTNPPQGTVPGGVEDDEESRMLRKLIEETPPSHKRDRAKLLRMLEFHLAGYDNPQFVREKALELLARLDGMPVGEERDVALREMRIMHCRLRDRDDGGIARRVYEIFLKIPPSDRQFYEDMLGLWSRSPAMAKEVEEMARATNDPRVLRGLGSSLIYFEDWNHRPGGLAFLSQRLNETRDPAMAAAILDAIGLSRSPAADAVLRDWLLRRDGEAKVRAEVVKDRKLYQPENRDLLASIVRDAQGHPDVRSEALAALRRFHDPRESAEGVRAVAALGLDAALPERLRAETAEDLGKDFQFGTTTPPTEALAAARGLLEGVIVTDTSRQVRDAARKAALAIWRRAREHLVPDLDMQSVELSHRYMSALEALEAQRKRGEITAERVQEEGRRLEKETDAAGSRLRKLQEAAEAVSPAEAAELVKVRAALKALEERHRRGEIATEQARAEQARLLEGLCDSSSQARKDEEAARAEQAYAQDLENLRPEEALPPRD